MRSFISKVSASVLFIIMSVIPASAQWNNGNGNANGWGNLNGGGNGNGNGNGWGNALAAPEIDASSGMLAVAALSIILLYVVERRRQAQNAAAAVKV